MLLLFDHQAAEQEVSDDGNHVGDATPPREPGPAGATARAAQQAGQPGPPRQVSWPTAKKTTTLKQTNKLTSLEPIFSKCGPLAKTVIESCFMYGQNRQFMTSDTNY